MKLRQTSDQAHSGDTIRVSGCLCCVMNHSEDVDLHQKVDWELDFKVGTILSSIRHTVRGITVKLRPLYFPGAPLA